MKIKKIIIPAILIFVSLCIYTYPYINSYFMPSMKWAKNLKTEEILKAEVFQFPSSEKGPYRLIDEKDYQKIIEIANNISGKYVKYPEDLNGGSTTIYITTTDEIRHKITNIGNIYIIIDGDYYLPEYSKTSLWDKEEILKGISSAPDNFKF